MTSVSSSVMNWIDRARPSLLSMPAPLCIHSTAVQEVAEAHQVHAMQRFVRTWTVTSNDPQELLTKLRLATPALTIVRVNPELLQLQRPELTTTTLEPVVEIIARIRVFSDEVETIDCVRVATKKNNELRLTFDDLASGNEIVGSLVTEIELTHASQISQVIALGGGDVFIDHSVVVNSIQHSALLVALHSTRLSVSETVADHLQLKDLLISSARGGEVYVSANAITALETLGCGVMGDGCIHVQAPRVWAKKVDFAVVGERGSVQIRAEQGLVTEELHGAVLGAGFGVVQSSPAVETGRPTLCAQQKLTVEGPGRLDVAGVPSESARIKIRGSGRVIAQPRHRVDLDVDDLSTVECVGSLPPKLESSRGFGLRILDAVVLTTSHHDRLIQHRIVCATAPIAAIPQAPQVHRAFETPQVLHVEKHGFRETFLRPFLDLL